MRLAIVGSRHFEGYSLLCAVMATVKTPVTLIVSGGAAGADTLAERYADAMGIEKLIFPAEWTKYGRSAGIRRNQDIVDNADAVIAFVAADSRGTLDTIRKAKTKGIPVHIVRI